MAWIGTTVASLLSNWHFLLGSALKHWLLSGPFLRDRQRRNGFWAVDRLLRNFGGVFRLDGNLDSSGKVELVRIFILKRALRTASLFTEQMNIELQSAYRIELVTNKGDAI